MSTALDPKLVTCVAQVVKLAVYVRSARAFTSGYTLTRIKLTRRPAYLHCASYLHIGKLFYLCHRPFLWRRQRGLLRCHEREW